MIRRASHIIAALTLSLMVIIMSGGMLIVHCTHSGATKALTLTNSEICQGRKACKPNASCMHHSVVKLSVMSQASSTVPQCVPPVFVLQPVMLSLLPQLFNPDAETEHGLLCRGRCSGPPRQYLSRLCVLLI